MKRLLILFWELFKISFFVIGGGYSIIIVADRVFARRGWTEEGELLDHLPVFQMIPGLIATHTAVYVGRKVAGVRGSVVGVLAMALPSVLVFTFVTIWYRSIPVGNPWLESAFVGLRASVAGIIGATVIRNWTRTLKDAFSHSLFVAAVLAIAAMGFAIQWVLLAAMALGLIARFSEGRTVCPSAALGLLVFLKYGALCFGGGFVLVPMYIEDFVGGSAPYVQLVASEFSNIMALTQMTPGPIGVNCATFFGYQLAGVAGALLASAFLLLPGSVMSFLAISSLEKFKSSRIVQGILKGARPAALALMSIALWEFVRLAILKNGGEFSAVGAFLTVTTGVLTMNRKINVIALIVTCALAATVARADDGITAAGYPDADAVVVSETEDIRYNADGTYRSVDEVITKILTEKGRRDESTVSTRYSARYGRAKIAGVWIVGTNGAERAVDVAATMKESTDNSSMASNIYDPLDRKIVCTVPGLQVGETIRTRIERETFSPRCENQWADMSVFEWDCPIVRSTLRITAPAERPLKRMAVRHPLGNLRFDCATNADSSVLYTWTATNSPQAFPEPDMPALYDEVQHVRVSTAADWRELSRWYWRLCLPHLEKRGDELTAKAKELAAGARDETAAVRAIYKWVSQEVRYMGLTMEDKSPGYAPHDVDITFANRYGVCRDKAGLLVAMLRAAGIEAYPTLINAGDKMDAEVPSPFFNHAIVAVAKKDGYELIDPTNESTMDMLPSYLSDCSYLVARPEGEDLRTTPVVPAADNELKISARCSPLANRAVVVYDLDFRGLNDTLFRGMLLRRKPSERREFFERVLQRIAPDARLLTSEVTPADLQNTEVPLSARITAEFPDLVIKGRDVGVLNLPMLSRSLNPVALMLEGSTALAKRRFPLKIFSTVAVSERFVCTADGEAAAVDSLPDPVALDGKYAFSRRFRLEDGEVIAETRRALNAVEFSPAEYAELRQRLRTEEAACRLEPIARNGALANAQLHALRVSDEVDFTGPAEWVSTNSYSTKILTYGGKKRASEVKLPFMPGHTDVKVVNAAVRGLDGSVTEVTPKEINVMDCDWAAAAPRYPAAKLLVINFPSVAVGSTIDLTLERRHRNLPLNLYMVANLDVTVPTDSLSVKVGNRSQTVANPRLLEAEKMTPPDVLWRNAVIVSSNTFESVRDFYRTAAAVMLLGPAAAGLGDEAPAANPEAIRKWMVRHVKVTGPSLFELPLERQLTDPRRVLRERYATRLDFMRTLAALLKGIGTPAEIVFAANLEFGDPALLERFTVTHPDVGMFNLPVCRVKVDGQTRYYDLSNEYAEPGSTATAGRYCYDPRTGTFALAEPSSPDLATGVECRYDIELAADGTAEIVSADAFKGAKTAGFRKRFAEMLPEERSRYHQTRLRELSAAAEAVGELEIDVEAYPAVERFACRVPKMAVIGEGLLEYKLPGSLPPPFPLSAEERVAPIWVPPADAATRVERVVFPAEYAQIERLPREFRFFNPNNPAELWFSRTVTATNAAGRLAVEIVTRIHRHREAMLSPESAVLLREWNRRYASPAERTLLIRRRP